MEGAFQHSSLHSPCPWAGNHVVSLEAQWTDFPLALLRVCGSKCLIAMSGLRLGPGVRSPAVPEWPLLWEPVPSALHGLFPSHPSSIPL